MNFSNIFVLFETAISNNLKFPKVRLSVNGTPVVVKLAGSKSKYQGDLMLTNGATYGSQDNKYFGRIQKSTSLLVAGRDLTPQVEALMQALAENPVATVKAHALLTGNCCFCDKFLNDARSTANGYGPICAKKYNLPWDAAKESKTAAIPAGEREQPAFDSQIMLGVD